MRIPIVEDEPRLLRSLSNALREEGYAVDTAEDGIDGLYKAGNYPYNVLILDVLLPKLDAWDVVARLRALIRRAAGQAHSSLKVGDITIETSSRTVHRSDEPVTLTAREFAILEYLALHRGQVVSRTQLYEHVLDENEGTLSNLIDVHIFAIRRKLGHRLITTRRGQGYSIA